MRLAPVLLLVLLSCGQPRIVAGFGDSLTSGGDWFGVFPQPPWTMLDFGEAGDECWADVGARFLSAAPTLEADVVVVFCGTNDVRHPTWTLQRSMDPIEAMALEAVDQGFDLVLVAPPPIFRDGATEAASVYRARLILLREAIYALGAQLEAPVADVWQDFLSYPDPQALFVEGVHPNGRGKAVMGASIRMAVARL